LSAARSVVSHSWSGSEAISAMTENIDDILLQKRGYLLLIVANSFDALERGSLIVKTNLIRARAAVTETTNTGRRVG
jgi:hypothetical protein